MSVSTDAILAYGYDLGDYPEASNVIEDENDEFWRWQDAATRLLLQKIVGFDEVWEEGSVGYWDREREANKKLGLEILTHCSHSYPMYFLATKSYTAPRGFPEIITGIDIVAHPLWDRNLEEALEILGLPAPSGPAWHLMSLWGE